MISIPAINVIPFEVCTAEMNMATDRYLLGVPGTFLRLYAWKDRTLTFGRSRNVINDIDQEYCRKNNIRKVRRISGGKTVLHQHELTYAFISDSDLFPDSVVDTYRLISQVLQASFLRFGLQTDMSPDKDDSTDSSICFREASAYELTVNSKKLVGSAQYRKRKRFFQHGSILLDIDWEDWKRVWKLPVETTELEERITSFRTELNREVEPAALAAVIVEEFGQFFGARMLDYSFDPEARKEIEELSLKYIWEEPGEC